jgi:hypothetical protein
MAKSNSSASPALPRFIVERNDYARCVGLHAQSEIQTDSDGDQEIETLWSGPESIFREIGVLPAKTPIVHEIRVWRPWIRGQLSRLTENSLLLTAFDEYPRTIEQLKTIERYDLGPDYAHTERIAHYGTEEALREAGVIRFPSKSWAKAGRHGYLGQRRDWFATRYPHGSVLYLETVGKTSEQRRQESERENARDFQEPDQWLEALEDRVVAFMRALLVGQTVLTKNGFRFSLCSRALADVLDSIELGAQRLRDVPVKVERIISEEEKAAARKLATNASIDAAFQRFLGQLPKAA